MYSLIIPVYKNQASLPDLLDVLVDMRRKLGNDLEVVFTVDGSPDNCYMLLQEQLPKMPFSSQLLLHSRNFGSFAAIRSGLGVARGKYFAVMAADLQDPSDLAINFFSTLAEGEVDVVVGARNGRQDPYFSRIFSRIYWWLYRKLVMREIPEGGVDMFGCNRQFKDELLRLEESHSSLISLIFWLGFRRKVVSYTRRVREHGKSAWTLHKKINYLMDSVFAFTDFPIKILIGIGAAGLTFSLFFSLIVLAFKFTGYSAVPGYAGTIITILFFGGLNVLGLGIIGSYVWRAYGNTQKRPLAIVMRQHNFPK